MSSRIVIGHSEEVLKSRKGARTVTVSISRLICLITRSMVSVEVYFVVSLGSSKVDSSEASGYILSTLEKSFALSIPAASSMIGSSFCLDRRSNNLGAMMHTRYMLTFCSEERSCVMSMKGFNNFKTVSTRLQSIEARSLDYSCNCEIASRILTARSNMF